MTGARACRHWKKPKDDRGWAWRRRAGSGTWKRLHATRRASCGVADSAGVPIAAVPKKAVSMAVQCRHGRVRTTAMPSSTAMAESTASGACRPGVGRRQVDADEVVASAFQVGEGIGRGSGTGHEGDWRWSEIRPSRRRMLGEWIIRTVAEVMPQHGVPS